MIRKFVPALSIAVALALPALAQAHPGHALQAGFASGFAHPWTGLDHLLAMTAVGLFAAGLGGRALWAVPLSFAGLVAVGGVLGLGGLPLPFVETMIALSVVLFGLAVATRKRWPIAGAMAFVAAFAVFHGYAHGAEAPAAVSAGSFGLGFVVATGTLHLAGIALGRMAAALPPPLARRAEQAGGAAIALAGAALLAGV